jgi:hypothetical protein
MPDRMYGEQVLQQTATTLPYPATPSLRSAVLTTIATPAGQRAGRWPAPRSLPAFAAVAVAIAVGVVAVLAIPSSRSAVADFFGIEGTTVDVVPTIPPAPTAEIDTNAAGSTLDGAAAIAGFEPALPNGDEPNAVYTVDYGTSTGIILRYDGFDLWQVDDGTFDGNFGKEVPGSGSIEDLTINGVPARWITGAPHFVEYTDADGVTSQESSRQVVRSTLIWRTNTALYRLETDLPLVDAVAIAETLP